MSFQTLEYALLLGIVVSLYWLVGRRSQNVLLLIASYVFYGFVHPVLVILLAGYTLVHYVAALVIDRRPQQRNLALGVAIASGLAVLGVFKYAGFFADNFSSVADAVGLPFGRPVLNILLPVGISFYTFQTMGYTLDVFKGRTQARSNLVDVATFIAFFPQLVAGPIERANDLLTQFERPRSFSPDDARDGVVLIVWGLFKKLVVADRCAIVANEVFSAQHQDFALVWAGVLAFGIQILADFSGYTDIARGSAALLGFRLRQNFNQPYASTSPSDFWRRWHMSLSYWFRDYVYIPVGGSRRGRWRNFLNLMGVFLLTGLWHGASWNFVVWGGFHGLLIQAHRMLRRIPGFKKLGSRTLGVAGIAITFVCVQVGWLIFREPDLSSVVASLRLSPFTVTASEWQIAGFLLAQVLLLSVPLLLQVAWAQAALPRFAPGSRLRPVFTAIIATVLFTGVVVFRAQSHIDFIYFQF